MAATPPSDTSLRVAALSQKAPTTFALRPAAPELAELATALELTGLRKLAFEGTLEPLGARDWHLKARLGATVVQPCVVTLDPVSTRIDIDVMRTFLRDYTDIDAPEVEMPEDDSVEPLGAWIDPAVVMQEELALALPAYPRAANAEAGTIRVTEPGKKPMSDEEARPFAGLAALKEQLGGNDDER
jgi:uncharacterized metal-binding protein YceD (DUF177 family)